MKKTIAIKDYKNKSKKTKSLIVILKGFSGSKVLKK